jgi:hypothetical protein
MVCSECHYEVLYCLLLLHNLPASSTTREREGFTSLQNRRWNYCSHILCSVCSKYLSIVIPADFYVFVGIGLSVFPGRPIFSYQSECRYNRWCRYGVCWRSAV